VSPADPSPGFPQSLLSDALAGRKVISALEVLAGMTGFVELFQRWADGVGAWTRSDLRRRNTKSSELTAAADVVRR